MKPQMIAPVALLVLAACGSSSPTSPGPTEPTQPFSLTIRTRVAPPAHTPIPGLLYPYVYAAVIDTPSPQWRGAWLTTDVTTTRFDNLIGTAHVRVGATPSTSSRKVEPVSVDVVMDGHKEIEVILKPFREQRALPLTPKHAGVCGTGWTTRAGCRVYPMPIYHDGPVSATITWIASLSGLSLELWREDDERLAVSTSDGAGRQVLPQTSVTGGHTYYLRILYDYPRLVFNGTINATS